MSVTFDNILVPTGGYGAILADPPWAFATYSDKGKGKSPDKHYDCVSLEEMKDWPVADLAARDCAMVMWATYPMIQTALDLMKAWGFTYKTGGTWGKLSKTGSKRAFGTGYIVRNACEPVLIGTRGKPTWLSKSERNYWEAPVREHSRKPELVHEFIERTNSGPYLELFARAPREGWTVWGNQTDRFA